MCYEPDAHPPLPPIRGSALDARALTLTSADGTEVAAYGARAATPSGAGIVICPDVRGLHPFYEELALRLAEAGVDAVAFDYFGRTAADAFRGEGFDYAPHVEQTRYDHLNADVAAAATFLRSPEGGEPARIFTLGFCFGGQISYLQAARPELDLAGVIGFYGTPVGAARAGLPAPVELADRFRCPVLALFGGADRAIPPEAREAFAHALETAGVAHHVVVYDGAPHSFFDRKATEFADASADAWRQVLDFVGAPSGTTTAAT
ncbi:MAG TPA: dienelactone hydrolase family protein [Candidatus Limnocylindria bacterium]|nr:dienelactone hydrolase family protein [Candidatus Limnocylindria bacterium]